jgi:hypothetical protein
MSTLYAGIDLHSNNNVVVVIDDKDKVVYRRRLGNELGEVMDGLSPFLFIPRPAQSERPNTGQSSHIVRKPSRCTLPTYSFPWIWASIEFFDPTTLPQQCSSCRGTCWAESVYSLLCIFQKGNLKILRLSMRPVERLSTVT